MKDIEPELLGQRLLSKGFRVWFKYMFRICEGTKFIEEELHRDLFDEFDDIYTLETTRDNINIPPRAGKTSMAKYFLAYCWAKNPRCNFIYTSYSQPLLGDISRAFVDILNNPVYRAMYNLSFDSEVLEDDAVDIFWADYLKKADGRETKYTTKKITSPLGGVVLFSSIGSSITGFGAGIRSSKEFSGALIIDDGNKPSDINSELMRIKTFTYFQETLLSRLNNPNTPIVNIQQRLHTEDLTGFLIKEYKFNTLARPLIIDGVCQLPTQYSEDRLKEIQVNDYMFQSQYQQKPYMRQGNLFKSSYWKMYKALPVMSWRGIYADTAQKTKENNDYTVLQCWGKSRGGQAFLIDQKRGKWEAPELLAQSRSFWAKHNAIKGSPLRHFKVEDKVSGTGLIQTLKLEGIPIMGIQRNRDKVTRAYDTIPLIETGSVYLPEDAPFISDYISEFSQFPKGKNDDQIDPTMDALTDILQNTIIDYSKF